MLPVLREFEIRRELVRKVVAAGVYAHDNFASLTNQRQLRCIVLGLHSSHPLSLLVFDLVLQIRSSRGSDHFGGEPAILVAAQPLFEHYDLP